MMNEKTEREQVLDYLKYGDKGDMVWMDENDRCAVRAEGRESTMPVCRLYEDWNPETEKGKPVGLTIMGQAVRFLYGEECEIY